VWEGKERKGKKGRQGKENQPPPAAAENRKTTTEGTPPPTANSQPSPPTLRHRFSPSCAENYNKKKFRNQNFPKNIYKTDRVIVL